ncbi:hypothetical protein RND71_026802 [Anisodus tanguticus]|uniref:RING-type E3 ubiquitin transferase n=1 Tax=Anisodus tanguticus TaxID=243964 RepID=A0AAE1V355_9SOLA|nr:hypothetical protein RND71_026802 [Anisodus tanguticus]
MFLPSSSNTPLLRSSSPHRHSLREAVRVFQRASNRTGLMMREPSGVQVHNDQQSNWAYSKPVVIIDVLWNFMYIIAAILVLVLSKKEDPEMPLRVWIIGYCLFCVLHVVNVLLEYKRRRYGQEAFGSGSSGYVTLAELTPERTRDLVAQLVDYLNFHIVGEGLNSHVVSLQGHDVRVEEMHDVDHERMVDESPQLYWLCIVFLAFDVFFVVFLLVMACAIGLGLCCCLPCIVAVLYAVADKIYVFLSVKEDAWDALLRRIWNENLLAKIIGDSKGAEKEDIEQLSKYTFRRNGCIENCTGEIEGTFAGFMTLCGRDTPKDERSLSKDDAECSICLSTYDDGDELRELSCGHFFHCTCIDKWLYMSATCPLCKRSIIGARGCCEEV